ncbi:MAG: cobalamin-binding protein, partial [Gemmatimonadota bacterium]
MTISSATPFRLAAACLVVLAACAGPRLPAGPIFLVDDQGDTVAIAAPARRIVSLIPSSTEILFALGAGDRVVGRTRWCDYPGEA